MYVLHSVHRHLLLWAVPVFVFPCSVCGLIVQQEDMPFSDKVGTS